MTFGNETLITNVKESWILPMVFVCTLPIPPELEGYALGEDKLALFLDSDNYSVNLEGESNFIYHNQFDGEANIIDVNYKRPVLSMQFLYHDYKIFAFLQQQIQDSLTKHELIEVLDYHYLKTRYILPTSLTISGGTYRYLGASQTEENVFQGIRYLPNGFQMTAVEDKWEVV